MRRGNDEFLGCHIEDSVAIHGNVEIGEGTSICGPADLNGNSSSLRIGEGCDIAAFVVINCADSHLKVKDQKEPIERLPIEIGNKVFVGTMSVILGGCKIGDGAVIGAGVILPKRTVVPPGFVVRAHRPIIFDPGVV